MSIDRVQVQNEKMVRDIRTGALLSTDLDSIRSYERKKAEAKAQKDRINKLESELSDLKKLVASLIEKR